MPTASSGPYPLPRTSSSETLQTGFSGLKPACVNQFPDTREGPDAAGISDGKRPALPMAPARRDASAAGWSLKRPVDDAKAAIGFSGEGLKEAPVRGATRLGGYVGGAASMHTEQ